MVRFIARRLIQAIPTILMILVLSFFLLRLAPGDIADVMAGESGGASEEYVEQLRQQFGLDRSLFIQLATYIKNVATFELGYSYRQNMAVSELILSRVGPTVILMLTSFAISIVLGIVLGIVAARNVNRPVDRLISLVSTLGYATPLFWVGLMLILIFSITYRIFPTSGIEDIAAFNEGFARVRDIAWHLVLPAVSLSLFYIAVYTRLMRSSLLEQSKMDYVVTAEAKGLPRRKVVYGHVLRNALLPILTMAGVQIGSMLGGSIIIESVFGWPGMGLLAYEALFARDLNLLTGILIVSSVMVILINVVVDVLYAVVDPRIHLK
ncbi:ABC transporter permease [Mesorhizobium sp. YM1C-6-2]|uniref:ABC transporter permease n=1 Tax=Mesorhizobium sp. YM1C-6-2 TaxID=1827501 RepID=UPI000EF27222|nr:ABC transporter permease [Mesorhizobium sp. YM1C-6-2]RLP24051.1 ABC transporter permease [Mesorhizobium sp. YM1C-6-2]